MSQVAADGVDTPRHVMELVEERWRTMTPRDKLEVVAELNEACERLSEAGVRFRHPGATDEDIRMRVFALRPGRDLMIAAYDWDPLVEGW